MARAFGSYPTGRWFKSDCRYQKFYRALYERSVKLYGPMVKRLRHRPFTAVTGVRFPLGSPHLSPVPRETFRSKNGFRRHSSAGRASAPHAGGHRFESCCLHQNAENPRSFGGFRFSARKMQEYYLIRSNIDIAHSSSRG